MKNSYFFYLLALLLPAVGQAQQISGKLVDVNNAPLPFANVLLLNAADSGLVKGALTDTAGIYQISSIPTGNYLLRIQMVGFTTHNLPVKLTATPLVLQPLVLLESQTQLAEVQVTGQREMIEVTPSSMVVNVSTSPTLQSGTVHDLLRKSPGISIDNNGNISLKGKQNVMVYLDGKQTYLSAQDLTRLLESLPAESIEKIEIMDNPPSRYDAAGNAGIINIIRKRDQSLGTNGSISTNHGYGRTYKTTNAISLNHRQKNWSITGRYGYNMTRRLKDFDLSRTVPYQDGKTLFTQSQEEDRQNNAQSYQLGIDYYLGKKTIAGIQAKGDFGNGNEEVTGTTLLSGPNPNPFDAIRYKTTIPRDKWFNQTYNAYIKQTLAKGEIQFDLDRVHWQNDQDQFSFNAPFLSGGAVGFPFHISSGTATAVDITAAKVDWSHTLGTATSFEAGAKWSKVNTKNSLLFEVEQPNGLWEEDVLRSNNFNYDEQIAALYSSVNHKFSDAFSLQLGLRLEQTFSEGYSPTLDSLVKRDYLNAFPNIGFSYNKKDAYSISGNYSRRVDRPNYRNLNPFEYFLDQFTFGRGNPFLQPQFTDVYSLTYGYKNTLFVNASWNHTTNAMVEVILQEEETQRTFQTTQNLARQENISTSITAPLQPTEWWSAQLMGVGFYNEVVSPFEEGGMINQGTFGYMFRASNTFNLPKEVKLEVTGRYQSELQWGMFTIEPQYNVDMGVSRNFGPLSVRAIYNDVFNTLQSNVSIEQGNIDAYVEQKWESRTFWLNLSYNFGNQKVKLNRRRGTASDDLQERAGS
jgi:hypothetical protein